MLAAMNEPTLADLYALVLTVRDAHSERLDDVSGHLAAFDTRFRAVTRGFDRIDERFARVDERLRGVEAEVKAVRTELRGRRGRQGPKRDG